MEGGGSTGEDLPVPAFLPGLAERVCATEDGERLAELRARAGIGLGLEAAGGSGVCVSYEITCLTRRESNSSNPL